MLRVCFPVFTVQPQNPNVCQTHFIEGKSMLFGTNYIPCLWSILNFFPTVSLNFTATKLFHPVIPDRTKHKSFKLRQNTDALLTPLKKKIQSIVYIKFINITYLKFQDGGRVLQWSDTYLLSLQEHVLFTDKRAQNKLKHQERDIYS